MPDIRTQSTGQTGIAESFPEYGLASPARSAPESRIGFKAMNEKIPEFPVITICGSMRFQDEMRLAAETLTANGYIVLMPFVATYAGNVPSDAQKEMLDHMHFVKIEMSSAILVIGDYIGVSTKKEIAIAEYTGKWVFHDIDNAIRHRRGM